MTHILVCGTSISCLGLVLLKYASQVAVLGTVKSNYETNRENNRAVYTENNKEVLVH